MLAYENRLISKKDFEKVYRSGIFFSFGDVSLKMGKNQLDRTRVGFSIGIGFSKKAVERNRVKRQIREIMRKKLKNIKVGFDLIIMLKKNGKREFSSPELEKTLAKIFEKSNLMIN